MVTKVEAYTDLGAMLSLPLWGPIDGFVVRPIEGLGPVSATISSSTFALLDGVQFQSSRRDGRNIVMKLGLRPNAAYPSVQRLRTRLYGWFMPKARVTLRFYSEDIPVVDIEGIVESCEPSIFSSDPEMTISIINTIPDFNALDETTFNSFTTSGTGTSPLLYYGTVPTGFLFELTADRAVDGFTINRGLSSGPGASLVFNGDLVAGDKVEINTVSRQKGAWLTHSGTRTSVLKYVSPSSDWINLMPGENSMRVYTPGDPIAYTLEYREKYGGL